MFLILEDREGTPLEIEIHGFSALNIVAWNTARSPETGAEIWIEPDPEGPFIVTIGDGPHPPQYCADMEDAGQVAAELCAQAMDVSVCDLVQPNGEPLAKTIALQLAELMNGLERHTRLLKAIGDHIAALP